MLTTILDRAKSDPAFTEIHRKFAEAKVENWLLEDEKVLHFAVGAYAPGDGKIVEIGSFKGGSACFLASGLRRRGHGRLTCVDPHLGAPPWFGTVPAQWTLEDFRRGTRECGVSDWIDARLGDSAAVAAIWPAEPIDCVFIDGDHSFLGALKDFECWGPKVKPGGLVMIDDADDHCLPEVLEMVELVKTLRSVRYLDLIQGIAVFERTDMPAWEMMSEVATACAGRRVFRPWDWSPLHRMGMQDRYLKSKTWPDGILDVGYQLCYLARCGAGAYGYSTASAMDDRAILYALGKDRGDGDVIELDATGAASPSGSKSRFWSTLRGPTRPAETRFRAILCRPEEAKALAPKLLPGGVLLARPAVKGDSEYQVSIRKVLLDGGLEGCGFGEDLHWGIWQPHHLAPDAVMNFAVAGAA